jgi:hypothetical protein
VFTSLPSLKGNRIDAPSYRELMATALLFDPTRNYHQEVQIADESGVEAMRALNVHEQPGLKCPACNKILTPTHAATCVSTGLAAVRHNIEKNILTAALATQTTQIAKEVPLDYVLDENNPIKNNQNNQNKQYLYQQIDKNLLFDEDDMDVDNVSVAASELETTLKPFSIDHQKINNFENDLSGAESDEAINENAINNNNNNNNNNILLEEQNEGDEQWNRFLGAERQRNNEVKLALAEIQKQRDKKEKQQRQKAERLAKNGQKPPPPPKNIDMNTFVVHRKGVTVCDIAFKHPAYPGIVAIDLIVSHDEKKARETKLQKYHKFLEDGTIQIFIPFIAAPYGRMAKEAIQLIQTVIGNRTVFSDNNKNNSNKNYENPQFAAQERMWIRMLSVKIAQATAYAQIAWRQQNCKRVSEIIGENKTFIHEEWLGPKMIEIQNKRIQKMKNVNEEIVPQQQNVMFVDQFDNQMFAKADANTKLAMEYLC